MAEYRELDIKTHNIVAASFNEGKGGIPFFFIHGITASINFWESIQLSAICERFRWYSLSLPGHYPANSNPELLFQSLNADMLAEVLIESIKKLVGKQPVILVGHSTGAFAALNIAARYPDMVFGVISISGFAHGKWNGALGLLQRMARFGPLGPLLFRISLRTLVTSRFFYRMAAGLYAKDQKALYSYPEFETIFNIIYSDANKLDPNFIFPYFNYLPDIDITQMLPLISAPTLTIAGTLDPIVPPDQSQTIAEKVPNCELNLLEGAGHLPMFERAKEYNTIIEKWIEGLFA
jgi:pimeloyl-ACP methyl ester carboxylesterase